MSNFCFKHLWSDFCKKFFSQSSEERPTGIFLLCVLICTLVLQHKHKVKATWKHIDKLTRCKIIVSLLGDCPFNYMFPECSYFGLGGKSTFMLHSICEQYQQIQGNRDSTWIVIPVEITVVILPVLLHQCIIIPRRLNRVISFPRKKGKILA